MNGRGGEIRTPGPLLPKQMRYQTALHPERRTLYTIRTGQGKEGMGLAAKIIPRIIAPHESTHL